MRKIQVDSPYKSKTIAAIGDSQTDYNTGYGVIPGQTWAPRLSILLNLDGALTRLRAFGISGNTTTQMLDRIDVMFLYDMPEIAIIYGGVNDPGNSINQATTQANIQAMCKALKYKVTGDGIGAGVSPTVASQSNLPAAGTMGQRYIVLGDSSTTGGRAANHSSQKATITGDYSASPVQSVWEYRNPQAGEAGWGRVAIASTPAFAEGVSKILVVTNNYLNYASGGDNYNTTTRTGTQFANYVPVRAAATAAATAEGVVLVDLYDYMSKLINGGTFQGQTVATETTQGSNSWHYTAGNQHHNAYGHDIVARACYLTIKNQSGWMEAIS